MSFRHGVVLTGCSPNRTRTLSFSAFLLLCVTAVMTVKDKGSLLLCCCVTSTGGSSDTHKYLYIFCDCWQIGPLPPPQRLEQSRFLHRHRFGWVPSWFVCICSVLLRTRFLLMAFTNRWGPSLCECALCVSAALQITDFPAAGCGISQFSLVLIRWLCCWEFTEQTRVEQLLTHLHVSTVLAPFPCFYHFSLIIHIILVLN